MGIIFWGRGGIQGNFLADNLVLQRVLSSVESHSEKAVPLQLFFQLYLLNKARIAILFDASLSLTPL